MAIKQYTYTVNGSGSNEQTWEISGTVECEFIQMHARIMQDTFRRLTNGQAIFGKPGVGCEGPYDIHKIVIEQVRH